MKLNVKIMNSWGILSIVTILAITGCIKPQQPKAFETEPFLAQKTSIDDVSTSLQIDRSHYLGFWENRGQINTEKDIRFYLETVGVGCYLRPDGITYMWVREIEAEDTTNMDGRTLATEMITLNWLNANPKVRIHGENPASDVLHYFRSDTTLNMRDVQRFQKVIYEELYPHIDMIMYIQDSHVKYDFVVKPGGNVEDIAFSYDGEQKLELAEDSSMIINGELGKLHEGKPYTYQEIDGEKRFVASAYRVEDGVIQFDVESYNDCETLIIDPTLMWATYYGGPKSEVGRSVSTDHLGNVYVVGIAYENYIDFGTFGAHKRNFYDAQDAFLIKFNAAGVRQWATYYGGPHNDAGLSVCNDHLGNVYLAGYTESDVDIAHNGHDNEYNQTSSAGNNRFHRDAFLVKFNTDGDRQWATYYGGEDQRSDEARGVATDHLGNVFLTGLTNSEQDIAIDGHQNSLGHDYGKGGPIYHDAFLVKFNSNGVRLWGTYFGKHGADLANDVCTDDWGSIYIAGNTKSTGMGYKGHDLSYSEDNDAFLAKFSTDGKRYWSTYYGDQGIDQGHSVATDGGFVYLAGITSSSNFIAHDGYDGFWSGGMDAFLVKFNFLGTRFWGTYYGGSEDEALYNNGAITDDPLEKYLKSNSVSVSKNGDVYLSGTTNSPSAIASPGGYDTSLDGDRDGFLVRFFPNGSRQWATYYGGDEREYIYDVTTDPAASVYIVGSSTSYELGYNGHDNSYDDSGSLYNTFSDVILAKFYPYGTGPNPGEGGGGFKGNDRPGQGSTGGNLIGNTSNLIYSPSLAFSPNPANGYTEVSWSQVTPKMFQLINMRGHIVYAREIEEEETGFRLEVGRFPAGVYTGSLQTEQGVLTKKLVVK